MKRIRAGELSVYATGGVDGDGSGEGPSIVLCHGFGAPGDDLVALADAVDVGREVRWFFPEAPLEIDFGFGASGRAWWPIDMAALQQALLRGQRESLQHAVPEGMFAARSALEGALEALEREFGVVPSRTIVGGFSQGSMLTTEVALHATTPFAALAVLSGTLLCRDRWEAAAHARAVGLEVLMTHGRRDPILPFAWAEDLRSLFEAAGARVTWVPHGGGHDLPRVALDGLAALARRTVCAK